MSNNNNKKKWDDNKSTAKERSRNTRNNLLKTSQHPPTTSTDSTLPPLITPADFVAARHDELGQFVQSYSTSTATKRAYQTLIRYKRRRAMSYNVKLVPLSLRAKAALELKMSNNASTKPIDIIGKRTRRNQAKNNEVDQSYTFKRLETHLYTAKRMKMTNAYGYRISTKALHLANRTIQKILNQKSVLVDNSFYEIVEFTAHPDLITKWLLALLNNNFNTYASIVAQTTTFKSLLNPEVITPVNIPPPYAFERLKQQIFPTIDPSKQQEFDFIARYPSFISLFIFAFYYIQNVQQWYQLQQQQSNDINDVLFNTTNLQEVYQKIQGYILNKITWMKAQAQIPVAAQNNNNNNNNRMSDDQDNTTTNNTQQQQSQRPPLSLSNVIITTTRLQYLPRTESGLQTCWLWAHPSSSELLRAAISEIYGLIQFIQSLFQPRVVNVLQNAKQNTSGTAANTFKLHLHQQQLNRIALRGVRAQETLLRALHLYDVQNHVISKSTTTTTKGKKIKKQHAFNQPNIQKNREEFKSLLNTLPNNTVLSLQVYNPAHRHAPRDVMQIMPQLQEVQNRYKLPQHLMPIAQVKASTVTKLNIAPQPHFIKPSSAQGNNNSTSTSTPLQQKQQFPTFWSADRSQFANQHDVVLNNTQNVQFKVNNTSQTANTTTTQQNTLINTIQQKQASPLYSPTWRKILSQIILPKTAQRPHQLRYLKLLRRNITRSFDNIVKNKPIKKIKLNFLQNTKLQKMISRISPKSLQTTHILLIKRQNNITTDPLDNRFNGWDIIIPRNWGRVFFLTLIKQGGANLIGNDQFKLCALQNNDILSAFPHISTLPNTFATYNVMQQDRLNAMTVLFRKKLRKIKQHHSSPQSVLGPCYDALFDNTGMLEQQQKQQNQNQMENINNNNIKTKQNNINAQYDPHTILQLVLKMRKWLHELLKSAKAHREKLKKAISEGRVIKKQKRTPSRATQLVQLCPLPSDILQNTQISKLSLQNNNNNNKGKESDDKNNTTTITNKRKQPSSLQQQQQQQQQIKDNTAILPLITSPPTAPLQQLTKQRENCIISSSSQFSLQSLFKLHNLPTHYTHIITNLLTTRASPLFLPPNSWMKKRTFNNLSLAPRLVPSTTIKSHTNTNTVQSIDYQHYIVPHTALTMGNHNLYHTAAFTMRYNVTTNILYTLPSLLNITQNTLLTAASNQSNSSSNTQTKVHPIKRVLGPDLFVIYNEFQFIFMKMLLIAVIQDYLTTQPQNDSVQRCLVPLRFVQTGAATFSTNDAIVIPNISNNGNNNNNNNAKAKHQRIGHVTSAEYSTNHGGYIGFGFVTLQGLCDMLLLNIQEFYAHHKIQQQQTNTTTITIDNTMSDDATTTVAQQKHQQDVTIKTSENKHKPPFVAPEQYKLIALYLKQSRIPLPLKYALQQLNIQFYIETAQQHTVDTATAMIRFIEP